MSPVAASHASRPLHAIAAAAAAAAAAAWLLVATASRLCG